MHLILNWNSECAFFAAMADLRPCGGPDSRASACDSGPGQLALCGLHGGGHPSELHHHVDARYTGTTAHCKHKYNPASLFFFFGLVWVPPPSPPQRAFDIMAGTSSQDTVIIKGHSVRTRKKQNVESPRLLFSYSAQSILFSIYYELFSNYRETFRKVVWLIV